MYEWTRCCNEAANYQLSKLSHPNSFREGMFKLNAKSDADSLLYLVILNATVTQYTCSLNGVYHPH